MARIIIDQFGDKRYRNDKGQLHREDGPAMIYADGGRFYYRNGRQTSTTQPVDFFGDGMIRWFANDHLHRDNGPADDIPSGLKRWYKMDEMIWPILE